MKFSSETIKKILVPTDGSDYSIHAAEYAISIAKTHDAQIMVVYVLDEVVIDRFSKVTRRAYSSLGMILGQRMIHTFMPNSLCATSITRRC